ncbi:hypothetical protein [Paenibacillus senegalensis]|uniref:hypothetical protein n=1 Tax=Paenibacillus senegalensis TaxID=1465766 RepID=UPI000306904E|nr:hypothetical protein [Paenibacillus senegalensis]
MFFVPVMLLLPKWTGIAGIYWGSLGIDAIIVLWTVLMVKKQFAVFRSKDKQIAVN